MFLTVEDGLILGPVCWLFGKIFELIYKFVELLTPGDVVNLSICVILFTIVIRGLILPVNFKQQKSSKIMTFIQPEINKATKKYNGKTDQESMMAKNQETQRIQKKYGVSMTAGCLPAILQLPVFYGLYRIIQNIPAYVSDLRGKYEYIVTSLKAATIKPEALTSFGLDSKATINDLIIKVATDKEGLVGTASQAAQMLENAIAKGSEVTTNGVIDVLDKLSGTDWTQLLNSVDFSNAEIANNVLQYTNEFEQMNKFLFGISIADAPGFVWPAILIPIFSAVFQFISSKVAQMNTVASTDPTQASANTMMKFMTYGFPIFSFFICLNLPVAIGLYWILGSIIALITTLMVNGYYKKRDIDEVLQKAMEKAAKKQAKKEAKHPGKKSFYEKMMDAQNGNVSTDERQTENINRMASSRLKTYNNPADNSIYDNNANAVHYKEGSIASKANIMLKYQNNGNEKGGKK